VKYDIKDLAAVTNMNMWNFSGRIESVAGLANQEQMPLTPDRRAGGIIGWEVIKMDGTTIPFSFDDFAECDSRTGNLYSTTDERDGNEIQSGFPAYADYGLQDMTTEHDVITTFPGNKLWRELFTSIF